MEPFFVLGTAKAGTTSIYKSLESQTGVAVSVPKETWYFCGAAYDQVDPRLDFLHRFLPHRSNNRLVGEVATSYLFFPPAAERLWQAFPDAKLIAVLRNPVERAYSDWWMMHSSGSEPLDFWAAIQENLDRIRRGPQVESAEGEALWYSHLESIRQYNRVKMRTYVDYGYYDLQLSRFLGLYPKDRLHVILFEEATSRPHGINREVSEFLDLPDVVDPSRDHRDNPAFDSTAVRRTVGFVARSGLHKVLPGGVRRKAVRWLSSIGNRPSIERDTRALLEAHYANHVVVLEKTLGIDLSIWKKRKTDQGA